MSFIIKIIFYIMRPHFSIYRFISMDVIVFNTMFTTKYPFKLKFYGFSFV